MKERDLAWLLTARKGAGEQLGADLRESESCCIDITRVRSGDLPGPTPGLLAVYTFSEVSEDHCCCCELVTAVAGTVVRERTAPVRHCYGVHSKMIRSRCTTYNTADYFL